MDKVREMVKTATNEKLFEMWKETRNDVNVYTCGVNAIIETELEVRGLIKLNEETFEYEVLV